MRKLFLCATLLTHLGIYAQGPNSIQNNFLDQLAVGDSMVYYQCHVESAQQELRTASGQTLQTHAKAISITEKFVLMRQENSFTLRHYVSSFTTCPNRRFSGLKFGEKKYWEFAFRSSMELNEKALKGLRRIEDSGKAANEYDLAITVQNTNQVIILLGKKEKQIGIKEGLLLSKLIEL